MTVAILTDPLVGAEAGNRVLVWHVASVAILTDPLGLVLAPPSPSWPVMSQDDTVQRSGDSQHYPTVGTPVAPRAGPDWLRAEAPGWRSLEA